MNLIQRFPFLIHQFFRDLQCCQVVFQPHLRRDPWLPGAAATQSGVPIRDGRPERFGTRRGSRGEGTLMVNEGHSHGGTPSPTSLMIINTRSETEAVFGCLGNIFGRNHDGS